MLPRPATVVITTLLFAVSVHAAKTKPVPCPGGRFVVEGTRLINASGPPAADAVVIADKLISIDSGCPPAQGKVKAKTKGTTIAATWASCTAQSGRVRLKARFDKTCSTLTGRVAGKKLRRKFSARPPAPPGFQVDTFVPVPLSTATIGPDGGTTTVTEGPLTGAAITFPPGAAHEDLQVDIQHAAITGVDGLPPGAEVASPLVRITLSGSEAFNQSRTLDLPAAVTLPYTPPADPEAFVRYYVRKNDGSLETAGFAGQDEVARTLTVFIRAFGDTSPPSLFPQTAPQIGPLGVGVPSTMELVAVALRLPTPHQLPTGFLPSANGWAQPNNGAYYEGSRGGNCLGIVGTAKHYYYRKHTPRLADAYRDNWPDPMKAPTPTWTDDRVALECVSRAQNSLNGFWTNVHHTFDRPFTSRGVLLTILGALYLTNQPVILGIHATYFSFQTGASGPLFSVASHAIMVYAADWPADFNGQANLSVYDPNSELDDQRRVTWTPNGGFDQFASGGYLFNNFNTLGQYSAMTDAELDALKQSADRSFADGSVFPTITITSIRGKNKTDEVVYEAGGTEQGGTTAAGEHKFITHDTAVVVRGTITGGVAQAECCAVKNAVVYVSNSVINAPVNNPGDGSFEVTVPVPHGEREFAIIGADRAGVVIKHWAAFYRNIIESTAAPASMRITLNWDQDKSDVDLYVKEPDGPAGSGKTGDTVYWSHREGETDTAAYLEFDNVVGKGPENYRVKNGTTTLYTDATPAPNPFGDYTARVHYYADHDANADSDQQITWHVDWRFLASCPLPCTDPEKDTSAVWQTGRTSGSINAADSSTSGDINTGGAGWSAAIPIRYPEPMPNEFMYPRNANLP